MKTRRYSSKKLLRRIFVFDAKLILQTLSDQLNLAKSIDVTKILREVTQYDVLYVFVLEKNKTIVFEITLIWNALTLEDKKWIFQTASAEYQNWANETLSSSAKYNSYEHLTKLHLSFSNFNYEILKHIVTQYLSNYFVKESTTELRILVN